MKIILDAFGGDHAPDAMVQGAVLAAAEYPVEIILVGDERKLDECFSRLELSRDKITVVHAPDKIETAAVPTSLMKEHKESSMAVAFGLLKDGEGDAFVSAGNSGAVLVGATLIIKRIKGIKRPALGAVIPGGKGSYMLMDIGANVDCRPEMLVQFGLMGSIYMEQVLDVKKPEVALLNNGAEEEKGPELYVEAHGLLKESDLNFVGNIEPRDVPDGVVDVVVCDGFSGNIVLKLSEGMAKTLLGMIKEVLMKNIVTKLATLTLKSGMMSLRKKMDYTEYGGAPLLGVQKPVIKAHGSSNAVAIKNAIRQAIYMVEHDVCGEIAKAMENRTK